MGKPPFFGLIQHCAMWIKATPGQREILGEIVDLLTPKLTFIIRRYKDLGDESYSSDFIRISTALGNSSYKASNNFFSRKTVDTLSNLHRWHGDLFEEDSNPENIYDWIEEVTNLYKNPKVVVQLWETKENALPNESFENIRHRLSTKEIEHISHLIQDRTEALHFLSDWQYQDNLPELDFCFRLYTRHTILLLYGLMKTNHLRIHKNGNEEIDINLFKEFLRKRVATITEKDLHQSPYSLKWGLLHSPRESELNSYFDALNIHGLPDINEIEDILDGKASSMEKEIFKFLEAIKNKLTLRERR